MSIQTITRVEIVNQIINETGLSRDKVTEVLEAILHNLKTGIVTDSGAKIASFGTFVVHNKNERIGRNPKTGKEAAITSRKTLSWRAANLLKQSISKQTVPSK